MGWKIIETRLHARFACLEGKEIAIHAGLHWDNTAISKARPWLTVEQLAMTEQWKAEDAFAGQIVALADVISAAWLPATPEASAKAMIDCIETRRFGLTLGGIETVTSRKIKGYQGMFKIDGGILRR
jgi:hypothetical protein